MKQFPVVLISGLVILLACNSTDSNNDSMDNSVVSVPSIMYQVVKKYPHDTASFTQGLVVHNGQVLESTGMPNTSWLGPVDLETGVIDKKVNLAEQYFGEGITILNDKIYQLTWQNKIGFIYDAKNFKKIGEFSYPTEGWGLTNDGHYLIMSDGSSNLFYMTPDSVKHVKTLSVTDNYGPVPNLNELEFIEGFIYANQWQTSYILKIDPQTGSVIGKLDLKKIQQELVAVNPEMDFLNGIAYDSASKKIYVTGKRWPAMYEIKMQ